MADGNNQRKAAGGENNAGKSESWRTASESGAWHQRQRQSGMAAAMNNVSYRMAGGISGVDGYSGIAGLYQSNGMWRLALWPAAWLGIAGGEAVYHVKPAQCENIGVASEIFQRRSDYGEKRQSASTMASMAAAG